MTTSSVSSETLHASCVVKDGRAVLIAGRSGSGKSDLALRLIDRGARLVSDDYTVVKRVSGTLVATAPANIAGRIEVRGIGIVEMDALRDAPVCLLIDVDRAAERMPHEPEALMIAGVRLPAIALNALEASAPVKVEMALTRFGLPLP
jgi:serine kinase of HPr protein (carbohydrate metabolism regulator)